MKEVGRSFRITDPVSRSTDSVFVVAYRLDIRLKLGTALNMQFKPLNRQVLVLELFTQ